MDLDGLAAAVRDALTALLERLQQKHLHSHSSFFFFPLSFNPRDSAALHLVRRCTYLLRTGCWVRCRAIVTELWVVVLVVGGGGKDTLPFLWSPVVPQEAQLLRGITAAGVSENPSACCRISPVSLSPPPPPVPLRLLYLFLALLLRLPPPPLKFREEGSERRRQLTPLPPIR